MSGLFFSTCAATILKLTSLPLPGAKPTVAVTGLPAGGCQAQVKAGAKSNIAKIRFIVILWKKLSYTKNV
jgi:hypothetical protein